MPTACQRVDVGESAVADTLLLRWTTAQINGVFWPNKVQTFRETVSKDPHDYKYIIFPSGSAICRLVRTSCWSPQYGLLTASERCFKTSERARKAWKMQHSDKFLRKQMTEVSVRDASAFISKNRLVRKLVHHQNAAYDAQTTANLRRCFKKHRKNCECCPVSLFIVRKQRMSWIHVLNCQNSNQCLNCQNSLR